MGKPVEIDLTLLNTLVEDLKKQFSHVSSLKKNDNTIPVQYIAEIAKCYGLATAVALEATQLTNDFIVDMKYNSSISPNQEYSKPVDLFGFADSLKPKKN